MEHTKEHSTPMKNLHTVLVGDSGVGKTTLIRALSGRSFSPTDATHGITSTPLQRGTDSDTSVVEIPGNTPFSQIRQKLNVFNPAVILVLIDPLRDKLQQDVARWSELFAFNRGKNSFHSLLVPARCDRGKHDTKLAAKLADKYQLGKVYETSAKDASGIQELRTQILNVTPKEEDEDAEIGDYALVVRTMIDSLCKLVAKNPNILKEIEWRELERIVAITLEKIGFDVELTAPIKDGGKDVIANCTVKNKEKTFYIEIKHWRRGDRPGSKHILEFVELNARDKTDGGLFLSPSGFTNEVYSRLGEVSRQRIRLGEQDKIVSLCQQYVRHKEGLWHPSRPLPELLFEHTLQ